MSVREYIGARYVPVFAEPAEWTNDRTYEPLTIVLHEGNSYTSRQYVPAGIDITNETFWAETGNYNAQVEAYRNEVIRYRTDTKDIQAMLPSSAFNASKTVKSGLDDLDTRIKKIEEYESYRSNHLPFLIVKPEILGKVEPPTNTYFNGMEIDEKTGYLYMIAADTSVSPNNLHVLKVKYPSLTVEDTIVLNGAGHGNSATIIGDYLLITSSGNTFNAVNLTSFKAVPSIETPNTFTQIAASKNGQLMAYARSANSGIGICSRCNEGIHKGDFNTVGMFAIYDYFGNTLMQDMTGSDTFIYNLASGSNPTGDNYQSTYIDIYWWSGMPFKRLYIDGVENELEGISRHSNDNKILISDSQGNIYFVDTSNGILTHSQQPESFNPNYQQVFANKPYISEVVLNNGKKINMQYFSWSPHYLNPTQTSENLTTKQPLTGTCFARPAMATQSYSAFTYVMDALGYLASGKNTRFYVQWEVRSGLLVPVAFQCIDNGTAPAVSTTVNYTTLTEEDINNAISSAIKRFDGQNVLPDVTYDGNFRLTRSVNMINSLINYFTMPTE